ncbi:Actin-related protein 8 [Smittium mucronatum]|uniref:Actin-related protein 8 n=1 Tax=Smittium mucronatum TaxID=133383 RepID=A0A1R0GW33_9FUNG|nr:Actin-related protein 8 [Smittium mucronatum]
MQLSRSYDWNLMNSLKERFVTLNLSDVNTRIYDFFVRAPKLPTKKYMFKVYDEMYLAPFCLFNPELINAYSKSPNWNKDFLYSYSSYFLEDQNSFGNDHTKPTQFGKLPSKEVPIDTKESDQIVDEQLLIIDAITEDPIISEEASIADSGLNTKKSTAASTPVLPSTPIKKVKISSGLSLSIASPANITPGLLSASDIPTPIEKTNFLEPSASPNKFSASLKTENTNSETNSEIPSAALSTTASHQTPTVIDRVYDTTAVNQLMPLDKAITHSIAHSGGIDKVKRFYNSIILVGGGISFIPNINSVLQERLYKLADDRTSDQEIEKIEKIEIFPSPRDLDPRVLVWKGGAVFSRLDITSELWIYGSEWSHVGARLIKDRTLFQW